MEIEARRVDVFAAMREFHRDVRFIGTLVGREACVAIDAEQRASSRARIGYQVRGDIVEHGSEVSDESECRFMGVSLVFILVRLEPVAIVVAFKASEETEEVGSEVRRHRKHGTRSLCGK